MPGQNGSNQTTPDTIVQDGWESVADYALQRALNPLVEPQSDIAMPLQHVSTPTAGQRKIAA